MTTVTQTFMDVVPFPAVTVCNYNRVHCRNLHDRIVQVNSSEEQDLDFRYLTFSGASMRHTELRLLPYILHLGWASCAACTKWASAAPPSTWTTSSSRGGRSPLGSARTRKYYSASKQGLLVHQKLFYRRCKKPQAHHRLILIVVCSCCYEDDLAHFRQK